MEDIQLQLSIIWISLMLAYLLGDVLRIFSGDYEKMGTEMKKMGQGMWFGISILMVIPIIMAVLTLFLPHDVNRLANIIVAGFFFLFNIIGLPTYPSWYDQFLIVAGLVFNVLTIALAFGW